MDKHFKYLVVVILLTITFLIKAQDATPLRIKQFNTERGLALQGYDAVAYLQQKKAIKGKNTLLYKHQGLSYQFSSSENLEIFKKSPTAFEPQYGGWCAYAMGAKGEKVEVDPETFKIINGKLYLFYHTLFNNTLKIWNNDEAQLKAKADLNWQKIFK